jgi:hypothetical protein
MDDGPAQSTPAYFHGIAQTLREIAARLNFDHNRRSQLLALADGFERLARRMESQAAAEPKND